MNALDQFAPAILRIYHRDKEAFWAAVLAPFLASKFSLSAWLQRLQVDVALLSAVKGLDQEARQVLKAFGVPLGLDVTKMVDDRKGLENDLAVGHSSHVTLGRDRIREVKDPKRTAQRLREDEMWVRETHACSKALIGQCRPILARLNDTILVKLADVTEARLDAFFQKQLTVIGSA